MAKTYDLVVIGGGTAGLVAAHGAAGIGASVAMIEPDHPGGDCLWTGCVPSKRLLAAAHTAHAMRTADQHGIASVVPQVDFAAVMRRVKAAQEHIAHHDSVERLEDAGVDVIAARGSFVGPGEIDADGTIVRYRKAMIATGASPIIAGIPGLRDAHPLTSNTLWDLDTLPERLLVIGGGAIGCELGQAMSRLGSQVTLVEAAPRILPQLGADVGELVAEQFRAEGMTVLEGARVTSVEGTPGAGNLVVTIGERELPFDHILVAVGRRAATARLNLSVVGVDLTETGHVQVDDTMRTTNDHIYAGGDVVGKMPFTHTAAYHGGLVVSNALFGLRRKADHGTIPMAIFCDPEVASVGRIDHDDPELTVSHFDYEQLDRQVTTGEPVGFVDLFTDDKGRLVGATIVGHAAGETINEMTARILAGDKLRSIGLMIRPYPTFAEGPARAANEVLRKKYFSPRTKRILGPVLGLLRRIDKPRP